MSLWADRRKGIYTSIFILVLVIFVGIPTFFILYEKPNCFDGKQNGAESGIDCGGPCVKLCQADFTSPQILWERSISVVHGIYNLLAYVENPNLSVAARAVPYAFKIYDSSGLVISEKTGFTNIPAGKKFAVFYPTVSLVDRIPAKVTFEFTTDPKWELLKPEPNIRISGTKYSSLENSSRVESTLTNNSLSPVDGVEVVSVVYDVGGNAVAFSRTVLDTMTPERAYPVVFTWPTPFPEDVSRVEILYQRLNP